MHIRIVCFILGHLLLITTTVKCSTSSRTTVSIKNLTDSENINSKPAHEEEDPFKKDIRRFSRDCGADVSIEETKSDVPAEVIIPRDRQTNPGQRNANWEYEGTKKNNKGTYPTHYGKKKGSNRSEEDSEEDEDEDEYRGGSNRRQGGNNRRNGRNKGHKRRQSSEDDESKECEDKGRNRNEWDNGWSNRGGAGGTRYSNKNLFAYASDPYTNEFGIYSSPEFWSRAGFSVYGGRLMAYHHDDTLDRIKRQNVRNDDQQCISQCVFGYLEMLDDHRVPAETEVVRYFQNKIVTTSERVRLIKMTRRCFAKLSTTEMSQNEDGCQFSKDLALCLQIEIKGENV